MQIKNNLAKNKFYIAILILFIFHILSVIFVIVKGQGPSPVQDPLEYRQLGLNILKGNGFSVAESEPFYPEILRTPAYPIFLAATYFLESSGILTIFLQQLIILAVAIFLFRYFRLWGEKKAFLGAAFVLLEPQLWVLSLQTMSETLFVGFSALLVYLLFYYKKDHPFGIGGAASVGLISALLILTRPAGILWLIFICIVLAWKSSQFRIQHLLIATFVFGVVVSPWLIRNHRLVGSPILSSSAPYNTVLGFGSENDRRLITQSLGVNHDYKGREGEIIYGYTSTGYNDVITASSRVWQENGTIEIIKGNLVCTRKVWFFNNYAVFMSMAGLPQWAPLVKQIDPIVSFLSLIFVGLGFIYLFKRKWYLQLVFLFGTLMATVIINNCISYGRMKISAIVPLVILCIFGMSTLMEILGRHKQS